MSEQEAARGIRHERHEPILVLHTWDDFDRLVESIAKIIRGDLDAAQLEQLRLQLKGPTDKVRDALPKNT